MKARFIQNISLTTLPLSALWFLSNPDYEPAITFISALAAALAANRAESKLQVVEVQSLPTADSVSGLSQSVKHYSKTVGANLKFLREKVFELSLREMAEFLNIDAISKLECFESGEEEYPLHLIKKIEEFFRINPRFVESGKGPLFLHFNLSHESVCSFISEGYTPILACCPNDRHDLFCYQIFKKNTNGYIQIAYADRYGSFASSGGGKMNIGYLISALLDAGKTPSSVRIIKATEEEWEAISNNSFYDKAPFFRFGCADNECRDIFDSWFEEYRKSREKWRIA